MCKPPDLRRGTPSRLPAVEVLLLLGGEGVDGQAHGGQFDPADGVVDLGV